MTSGRVRPWTPWWRNRGETFDRAGGARSRRRPPRLECGVFGVFGVEAASGVTALGLHALQHRGQRPAASPPSTRSASTPSGTWGQVGDAFGAGDVVERLPGENAIGHTRYSTAGGSFIRNVQPMFADLEAGGIALAHNGNLTNFLHLRERLVGEGAIFQSTSDSEVIIHLIARSSQRPDRREVHRRPVADRGRLRPGRPDQQEADRGARPARHPPLVLGDLEGRPVLASETCALDTIGARFVRDIEHASCGDRRRRHPVDAAVPGPARAPLRFRIRSTSPAPTAW